MGEAAPPTYGPGATVGTMMSMARTYLRTSERKKWLNVVFVGRLKGII
jgi:hypothetical protein